jgi:hypothetical protein
MAITFVDPLSRAVERMRQMLFQPFDLVKWLVLGFSAWLAGLASGAGGGTGASNFDSDAWDRPGDVLRECGHAWDRLLENVFLLPLGLLLISLLLVIVLLLLWISSRAKFIFLDNVVHDRAQIKEPWKRFQRLGNSLFLWRFGFVAACFAVLMGVALLVLAPAATLSLHDAVRGLSFAGMFLGILLAAVIGVVIAYILLLLENFVIPIMYRFDLKATDAWRAFLPWLRAHPGWFFLYGLFVLLAAIPVAFVIALLVCCTCCIVALPYIGTVILLPMWVAYRALGPEFLAQFDPKFDLFTPALPPIPETAGELTE